MSDTTVNDKPPQSGLVDMGDIDFYNDPSDPCPPFTLGDLNSYAASFSEIVLNVTWAELQPNQGGPINTATITQAIEAVETFNADNGTDIGIKLRVWGAYTAPDWAKTIDGPPITVTGVGTIDPNQDQDETIGRFWTADYIDAWTSLQTELAQDYDSNTHILGISDTAGASASDEPFVPLHPDQVTELEAGGYTDAAEELTLRAAIADYAAWSTTPLDYTMNMFHLEGSGTVIDDPDVTLAVLQEAENSSRTVQAGNHALNTPTSTADPDDSFIYLQLAEDAALNPATVPASYQTASPVNLGSFSNWAAAVAHGAASGGGDIELWDGPGTTGFTGETPSFVAGLAAILADGVAPVAGAPDDGAPLGFVAPASVTGTAGAIAFAGTNAVLLASGSIDAQAMYTITVTSADDNMLTVRDALIVPEESTLPVTPVGITGADGVSLTPASGTQSVGSTSLTFSGSLDAVNTILASLTDAVAAGTDLVTFTATDSGGDTATRRVGVSVSTPMAAPADASDPSASPEEAGAGVSYTWTGSGPTPLYSNAANWSPSGGPPGPGDTVTFAGEPLPSTVAGSGSAGTMNVEDTVVPGGASDIDVGDNLDIVGQGTLVLAGVDTTLAVAGNLDIGGTAGSPGVVSTLIAELAPDAYSTADLAIGGTLQIGADGAARFTGGLTAGAVAINGGLVSGDGTVTASGGITNDGTIEAAADQALGLQQLTLASSVAGTGTLLIDAGATLILAQNEAAGAEQTVVFAPPTIGQFSDDPYSPSTLALESPYGFLGTMTGFSFADSLVLDGLSGTGASYNPTAGTLVVDFAATGTAGIPSPLSFSLTGTLTGLTPTVTVTGTVEDPITTISFVEAQRPSVVAPANLQAGSAGPVFVPNIVLNTPQPAEPGDNSTVIVTVTAGNGVLAAASDHGNTTITQPGTNSLILAGPLGAVETSLQTLSYTGNESGTDSITVTLSDYAGTSPAATILVTNGTVSTAPDAAYTWSTPGGGDFAVAGNWEVADAAAPSAPGGVDGAAFGPGNVTVGGDGAVGRITVNGGLTLTGAVNAHGLTDSGAVGQGIAAIVNGGALTLSGGASLTNGGTTVIGLDNDGLLTVASGALTLTGTVGDDLVLGQEAGGDGTVLDLEQIEAAGTVIVGGAGSGVLRLLGAAASVSDGAASIGQSAGAAGLAVVDGGDWATEGLLTVGDTGSGSLLIGGSANGIAGQATAIDATIGAAAGGAGTVTVAAGDLLVAGGTVSSSTLAVGAGGTGTLALSNGSNVTVGAAEATVVGAGTVYNNGTFLVGGASGGGAGLVTIGDNASLEVDGGSMIGGAVGAGSGSVVVGQTPADTALFAMTGSLMIGATGAVSLGGASDTLRASAVSIGAGGSLSGLGTLSGDGGGNGTVMLADVTNDGRITAAGGTLLVYATVAGSGTLAVQADASLTLQAAVGSGQTLTFGPAAEATLDDVGAFQGTITGFAAGDRLDVASTDATGALWTAGILTLATSGAPITLDVAGNYATDAFTVAPDNLGGTDVTLAPVLPCFAAGTRIRTPAGFMEVGALAVGDLVVTLSGASKPIRWIGHRRVDCRRHPDPVAVCPIRIRAHAFGPGLPVRDLFLSPDHAVYAEDVLIPIKYLLNRSTVRQIWPAAVTYYHLELDAHDVVLADDLPTETFLDTGNRGAFASGSGSLVQLHPDFAGDSTSWRWDALGYAPLCVSGPPLERVMRRLRQRSTKSGPARPVAALA